MVIEYVHGHCATQNTVLYVNTHVCYGQLQLFTLHFVLSSGALLCQVGGGGYKVPFQVPCSFLEGVYKITVVVAGFYMNFQLV
jgi:hypothetical protein